MKLESEWWYMPVDVCASLFLYHVIHAHLHNCMFVCTWLWWKFIKRQSKSQKQKKCLLYVLAILMPVSPTEICSVNHNEASLSGKRSAQSEKELNTQRCARNGYSCPSSCLGPRWCPWKVCSYTWLFPQMPARSLCFVLLCVRTDEFPMIYGM